MNENFYYSSGPFLPTGISALKISKLAINETKKPSKVHICNFNLSNKCKYGEQCKFLHIELPFIWQYLENNESDWKNFPLELNGRTENAYFDVKIKKFNLKQA